MGTTITRFLQAALILSVLGIGRQPSHAQDGNALLQRMKTKYESVQSLRAGFKQTMTSDYLDNPEATSGTLILKGDQYRIETPGHTLVTDGLVTYVYNASENQLLINDYEEDETTFSLHDFFSNHEERFRVTDAKKERLSTGKHHILTLASKDPDAFFRQVTIYLRDRDNIVTRLEVRDANETTMVFELTNVELDPVLEANTFSFTPPGQETEIIDLRS